MQGHINTCQQVIWGEDEDCCPPESARWRFSSRLKQHRHTHTHSHTHLNIITSGKGFLARQRIWLGASHLRSPFKCGRVHWSSFVRLLMRPFYPRGLLIRALVMDLAIKVILHCKSLIIPGEGRWHSNASNEYAPAWKRAKKNPNWREKKKPQQIKIYFWKKSKLNFFKNNNDTQQIISLFPTIHFIFF